MGFKWTNPPTKAFSEMYDIWGKRVYLGILEMIMSRAPEMQNWMKQNAPWTDRTGNARQGLAVDVLPSVEGITVLFTLGRHPGGGTLDYGRYLELCNQGRYAVVGPAVDYWGPVILQDVKRLLR
jgi:hypothetical protein